MRKPLPPSADPGIPESAKARLARLRFKSPVLLAMAVRAIREARIGDEVAQLARAARVGRDTGVQHGHDYGPGIRLSPVRGGRRGEFLRGADVEIEFGADPDRPNRTVRRARRSDPLLTLKRAGSITGRQVDAGELLREHLEGAQASIPCTGQSEIHVAPFDRVGTSDRQVNNCRWLRNALQAVSAETHPVLLWVVLGGSIGGFSRFTHVGHITAAKRLKQGLGELADHYFGKAGTK